ncbi:biotin--[acetyl-CoA-carboxylase] ligase [Glacieibacterium frigidum]|uniref:biotin--[acetyl-CoA-carboxylase] ligase n=1 Tax=Glacieibacterium frigidum TaxID=2593303 RepID=UPI0022A66EFB|nr:biotin--[acetyl-CoA-carboxylase] ligase [Glacieibacterium frigidum]
MTHLATVGSTNDWLTERAATLPDGSWVFADAQTGGRGRRGRAWTSLPGNVFASVLTRPQPGEGPTQQLSFVAALTLAGALDSYAEAHRLTLKWPNDVLLDGTKVAGILLEKQGDACVIGIGVNLAAHPVDSERPATSLAAAGIAPPSPSAFVEDLSGNFVRTRATWRDHGFAATRTAWLARAAGIGRPLVARLGSEALTGVFEGLADDGALQLRLDNGAVRAVHAGEVFGV